MEAALKDIENYEPDVSVVSLGVDTYGHDPIGAFKLETADFITVGQRIASLHKPTLFVLEGGYALAEIVKMWPMS